MIDVGGIKFGIDLTGAVQSLTEVRNLKSELLSLDDVFKDNKKAQREYLAEIRRGGKSYQGMLRGVRDTQQMLERLKTKEQEYTRLIQREYIRRGALVDAYNAKLGQHAKQSMGFASWSKGVDSRKELREREAAKLADREANDKLIERELIYRRLFAEATKLTDESKRIYNQVSRTNEKTKERIQLISQQTSALLQATSAQRRAANTVMGANTADTPSMFSRIFASINAGLAKAQSGLSAFVGRLRSVDVAGYLRRAANSATELATAFGGRLRSNITRVGAAFASYGKAVYTATVSSNRHAGVIKRIQQSMASLGTTYNTWWRRFGLIAIGFAVAYRAINLFERGVYTLTATFTRGLSILNEYQEGLAVISGMIALTWKGGTGFQDRYTKAANVLRGAMEQAVRLAPKYRLSMEEVTAGFRELAQFGVIVTAQSTDKTLNTLAMIKEIAAATGSTTKQIRQEIQAIFNGQARVTDQFTKMIKQTLPDLYTKLSDMTKTPQERWNILIDSVSEFRYAIVEANQTISGQFEIAKNSISVISLKALRSSGLFGQWVDKLRTFNEGLFNTDGTLGEIGKQLYITFGDIWTSIDYSIKSIVNLGKVIADVFNVISNFVSPFKEIITSGIKALAVMIGLKTVAQIFSSILFAIANATGFTALLKSLYAIRKVLWTTIAPLAAGVALGYGFAQAAEFAFTVVTKLASAVVRHLTSVVNVWVSQIKLKGMEIKNWFLNYFVRDIEDRITVEDDPMYKLQKAHVEALKRVRDMNANIDAAGIFAQALTNAQDKGQEYVDGLLGIKDAIVDAIGKYIEVPTSLEGLMDNIKEAIGPKQYETVKDHLKEFIDSFSNIFGDNKVNVTPEVVFSPEEMLAGLKPAFEATTREMISLTKTITSEMDTFWDELFTGKLRTFSDMWQSMMNAMVRSFQKAMSDMASVYTERFLKAIATSLGGSGDSTLGSLASGILGAVFPSTKTAQVTKAASGGIIPEHVWGIGASGRRYEFGEQGPERVLSNKDSFSQSAPQVYVNVNNNSSGQVSNKVNSKFDGKKMIIDIVLEDYANGGPTYRMLGAK